MKVRPLARAVAIVRTLVPALVAAVLIALVSIERPAQAQGSGAVVLTIDGAIDGDTPRDLSVADLERLGITEMTTNSPWYDDPVTFSGVRLATLMESVGTRGDTVVGAALNNYYIEIPLEDFTRYDVLLAFKANGKYLTVRDKGPLFVIYPFDRFPDIRNELYYSRSIWQLRRLTVK